MTEETLRRRLARHNALYLAFGLILIPTAIGLWFLSFWIFRLLALLALWPWIDDVWGLSFYLALGGTAILAVEGLRRTRPLFDLDDYRRSFYDEGFMTDTETGAALRWYLGNPLGVSYLVSQGLFLAPQATIHAVLALRKRMRFDPQAIRDAARILRKLEEERRWHAVSDFPAQGAAMCLLDRLGLIRARYDNGQGEIRLRLVDPA